MKKINIIGLIFFINLIVLSSLICAVPWEGTGTLFHDHMTSFENYTPGYNSEIASLELFQNTWFENTHSTIYKGNSYNMSDDLTNYPSFITPNEWKVTGKFKLGTVNFHHFFGYTTGPPDQTKDLQFTLDNGRLFFLYDGAYIYYTSSAVTTNETAIFTWWYNKSGLNHITAYYGTTRLNGTGADNAVVIPALTINNFGLKTVKTNNGYNWINFTDPNYVPPPPVEESTIDLLFSNESNKTDYKTLFDEGEDFNIFINYTDENNNPINNSVGNCNITVIKGLYENKTEEVNFTICNSGCDVVNITQNFYLESNISVTKDIFKITACHDQIPTGEGNLTIQCGDNSTSYALIPGIVGLCTEGFSLISVETTQCINHTNINITITTELPYNKRKKVGYLEIDREFSTHLLKNDIDTIYNSSSELWESQHTHEFYEHGSKNIYVNCTHVTSSYNNDLGENITIVNAPPIVSLSGILNNHGFNSFNGGTLNVSYAYGNWSFIASVVDDDLFNVNITVYNSSEAIFSIQQSNFSQGIFNLSSIFFNDFIGNPFNITMWANDTNNNMTYVSRLFNITDLLNPVCTGLTSQSVTTNSYYNWSIYCTDENFYSFNLSCDNGISKYIDGLNVPSYNYLNSTIINETVICKFEYCDGHTDILKSDWYVRPKENKIEFQREDFTHILKSTSEDLNFNYTIGEDRILFELSRDFFSKKKEEISFEYTTGPNSHYFKSDKYNAWIVDSDSRTWFDLNNNLNAKTKVTRWNETTWLITLTLKNKDVEKIKFKSIGELNCITGTQTITAVTPELRPPLFRGFASVSQALGYIFLYCLWICMLILFIKLKGVNNKHIQILNFFQLFIGFVCGLSFIGLSFVIGFATVFVAVAFFLGAIFNS